MRLKKDYLDLLGRLHLQWVRDKENDSMETGSFPVIRAMAKPVLREGSRGNRVVTSILVVVLCALLGFGYALQINRYTSIYETMSEDELTRLIGETNTQVQNLERRKLELEKQLRSLRNAADKQKEALRITRQNEETNGLLSGRLPATGKGVIIRILQGDKQRVDASTMFQLLEELRNAGVEVMSLNRVRVVTSTYVSDTEHGLESDGQRLESPYIIKAIGDPQNLQNSVNIAGGVGSRLKVKFGAVIKVEVPDTVVIDEVRTADQYKYAKIVQ